jgi:Protein of unknown function (DUF2911)
MKISKFLIYKNYVTNKKPILNKNYFIKIAINNKIMKNLLLCIIAIFLFNIQLSAQLKIPQLSPKATISQQIGLSTVSVTYGRPSLRGRILIGTSAIPYGKVYRLGANEATLIQLDDDIQIADKIVKKGKYAIAAIPNLEEWTIIINADSKQWGVYEYNESKDVCRIKVKSEKASQFTETMQFSFLDVTPTSASLTFNWQNVEFKIPISHDCDTKVMAQIKELTSKKSVSPEVYIESAEYLLLKNKNLDQALVYTEKGIKGWDSAFTHNLKAQIAEKLFMKELAIREAKMAIIMTEKNGDVAAKSLAESIIKRNE